MAAILPDHPPPRRTTERPSRGPSRSAAAGRTAATTRPPAAVVPVPAVGHRTQFVGGPRHDVRHPRPDLVITARAAIHLRRLRTRNGADEPIAVLGGLGARPPGHSGPRALVPRSAMASRHASTVANSTPHPGRPAPPHPTRVLHSDPRVRHPGHRVLRSRRRVLRWGTTARFPHPAAATLSTLRLSASLSAPGHRPPLPGLAL